MAYPVTIKVTSDIVLEALLNAKQIVVVCGAGISVAGGIPSFRGKEGLYSLKSLPLEFPQVPQVNIVDLFGSSIYQDSTKMTLHCQVIAGLAKLSILAKPTSFHHFLRALDIQQSLLRLYTQNVDGLELKAGLHTSIPTDFKKNQDPPVRCIPLHGTLDELRCSGCGSIFKLEPYYPDLKHGLFPECSHCRETVAKRVKEGKRVTRVPRLRSNIILYGDTHPQGEEIAEVQKSDIGQVDMLLVVGTSLAVAGTATLIRQFSKALHNKFPTENPNSPRVIYLNDTFTNPSCWKGVFDRWVEMDCQEFAEKGLDKIEASHNESYTFYADRRLDARPSWRL